jgi:hypothetical protein
MMSGVLVRFYTLVLVSKTFHSFQQQDDDENEKAILFFGESYEDVRNSGDSGNGTS